MKCELTKKSTMIGNRVGDIRGNVTGRTSRQFKPNIHTTRFQTKEFGNLTLKIAANTKKTIDKYGGLTSYLMNISENQLSQYGLLLKRRLINK
jgi:ribosomal protein L28